MQKNTTIMIIIKLIIIFLSNCSTNPPPNNQTHHPQNQPADITVALERGITRAFRDVPKQSIIAIVHIATPNRVLYDFLLGELEHLLVDNGYNVVDRSELDIIRREQNFQLSWEVDDRTAVSIGKIVGADVIVIGRMDGEGALQRARLRVLNTETALVMGTASEPFTTSFDFSESLEDLATTQTITITSNPLGANILIYDRNQNIVFHGQTPTDANLNTFINTNYLVIISKDGYQNFEQTIQNNNRVLEPNNIFATLTRVPIQQTLQTTQTLNISSTPSGSNVRVHNQSGEVVYAGTTPTNVNLNTILNESYLVVIF